MAMNFILHTFHIRRWLDISINVTDRQVYMWHLDIQIGEPSMKGPRKQEYTAARKQLLLAALFKSAHWLGGQGGWITRSKDPDHPVQHGEASSLLKNTKISWAWWRMPVVPATLEAEAGALFGPRRQRLQ